MLWNKKSSLIKVFSWADFVLLIFLIALLYTISHLSSRWNDSFQPYAEISLSIYKLPYYALLSFSRGFAAYILSLLFSLTFAYIAAYNQNAEKIMIPLLDILQSTPVLGFLPGLVIGLVSLFPHSNTGLELACILMFFSSQAWNMTFSFFYSLKSIPRELYEASQVYQLSKWKRFIKLELPFGAIGLVWNSMMSMAGGWFFLTVTEAFVLGSKDFRLPGIGSYMSLAIERGDNTAMFAAILTMILMIVFIDKIIWKPLVIWSQKFKIEEQESENIDDSTVLKILRRTEFFSKLTKAIRDFFVHKFASQKEIFRNLEQKNKIDFKNFKLVLKICTLAIFVSLSLVGIYKFWILLSVLNFSDALLIGKSLLYTFLRVAASTALATLWSVPVGIWIGMNSKASKIFQPLIQILAFFPAPMVFPLLLIFIHKMGSNLEWGSILLMMAATQWYILFNVIAGAQSIPSEFKEAAYLFRLNWKKKMQRIILPAIYPYLVTGWITAVGGAWNASIVTEYIRLEGSIEVAQGLGSVISIATDDGNFPLLAGAVLALNLVVVGLNRVFWNKLQENAQSRFGLTS